MTKVLSFVLAFFLGFTGFVAPLAANADTPAPHYYSTKAEPMFYGAAKITLPRGFPFDPSDTRFRSFVKDFEDGDLTQKVTSSSNVNTSIAGEYALNYSVTDSHGNSAQRTVPVTVVGDPQAQVEVEWDIYARPNTWNIRSVGINRGDRSDRQHIGLYLAANDTIEARIIGQSPDLRVNFLTANKGQESTITLKKGGNWTTLKNVKNGQSYPSVPQVYSPELAKDATDISQTYRIALRYPSSAKMLNYYRAGDEEIKFRTKWKKSGAQYAVVENDYVSVLTGISAESKLTTFKRGFKTLNQFLQYYANVIEMMDSGIGLSLHPSNALDQNVRTRYTIRPVGANGWAAYYSEDHVGISNADAASFYEMNWGGLHELGHGYQGRFGQGKMFLNETSNNIFAHYIQQTPSVYFHGPYGFNMNDQDVKANKLRIDKGKNFSNYGSGAYDGASERLYAVVNLLDGFEGLKTYAKIFQWYRSEVNAGRDYDNQDVYARAIAAIYGVNVIPYLEKWGLRVSDATKSALYDRDLPLANMLGEILNGDNLAKAKSTMSSKRTWQVVKNKDLPDVASSLTVRFEIDKSQLFEGKSVSLKSGDKTVATARISGAKATFTGIPVGTYVLQLPILSDYESGYNWVDVKDTGSEVKYVYRPFSSQILPNLKLRLAGIYHTFGYQLQFARDMKSAKIAFRGSSMGNAAPAVKIFDTKGVLVDTQVVTKASDGNYYFNHSQGTKNISLQKGYRIEVSHHAPGNVTVFDENTNTVVAGLNPKTKTTTYIVEPYGLRLTSQNEDQAREMYYQKLKEPAVKTIRNYQNSVRDEILADPYKDLGTKNQVRKAFAMLRGPHQAQFADFIEKISANQQKSQDAPDQGPDLSPEVVHNRSVFYWTPIF